MAFYGVYVPPKFEPSVVALAAAANNDPEKNLLVFAKKEEAFKVLKTHSDARVKGFANREEACHFAQYGQDLLNVSTVNQSLTVVDSPISSKPQQQQQMKSPSSALNPEKTAFRGPKIQEMVEFRKSIESGNLTVVHSKIMENPRFLIGSGDTPAILKEGQRYNAMHVAALSKNAKMCELILSTLKPSYVQMFHGGRQTKEVSEEVAGKLLDLYLNTPEKGRFETPLHLAVKYGAADVVEVLTSYPQCRMLPNKEDHMPKDIICFRAPSMGPEVKERIAQLLEERFYVPVLRSTDATVPPVIGEPVSTRAMSVNLSGGSGNNNLLTPELQIRAYAGPMEKEQAESFRQRWRTPPAVYNRSNGSLIQSNNNNTSLLSVSLGGGGLGLNTSGENVLLLRSPIRSQPGGGHRQLQRLMLNSPSRTPPVAIMTNGGLSNDNNYVSTPKGKTSLSALRSIDEFFNDDSMAHLDINSNNNNNNNRSLHGSNESLNRFNRKPQPGMGLELSAKKALFGNNSNNNNNNVMHSPIKSPLLLLQPPVDDEVESDLDASYRERHLKLTDNEKGLETVGRLLAKERNVGWSEYWAFLDNFTNLTTPHGMQQLEQHFKSRAEQMERDKERQQSKRGSLVEAVGNNPEKEPQLNISDICDRLNELHLNNSIKLANNNGDEKNNKITDHEENATQPALNAFLCVEKSCQVYARRAMKKIVGAGVDCAAGQLNKTLNGELMRLESLVCSYKDDQRFKRVDFQVVHSRFAHLVLTYLLEDDRMKAMLSKWKRSLMVIRSADVRDKRDVEEDKGAMLIQESDQVKSTTSHARCLAKFLITYAENEEEKMQMGGLGKLVAEEDCQRRWAEEAKCECVWIVPKGSLVANAAGQNVKNPHMLRMRDKNKKKRINDRIKRKIELSQAESNNNGDMWEYRNKLPSLDNEDDVIWADSNDSDHSVDSTDSDECFFYTPVESPTEFLTASDRSDEEGDGDDDDVIVRRRRTKKKKSPQVDLSSYRNYILGDEPTKTDMDVFNAICDVDVDEKSYPSIYKWQEAIRLHSMEEIQNFPSLSMIVRKSIPICRLVDPGSPMSAKRLFGGSSPMKW